LQRIVKDNVVGHIDSQLQLAWQVDKY
jgi:hypothetical protein